MRVWLILAAMIAALAMTGCVRIQSDPDSVLPGNAPANWEGKSLAVPL